MRTLTDYEMAMRTAWKLKTVSQMVPDKFYDFIGEVCYLSGSESNRTTMMMTDYTENEMLPYLESKGVRPKGKATILVTLWDEHFETFLKLKIKAGDVLYLKNLRCKVDLSNVFQLSMNGFKGRGFEQIDPIQILLPDDPRGKEVRARKAEYEMRQLDTEGVALSGVHWPQMPTSSGYTSYTSSALNATNAGSDIKFSANTATPGTITGPQIATTNGTSSDTTMRASISIVGSGNWTNSYGGSVRTSDWGNRCGFDDNRGTSGEKSNGRPPLAPDPKVAPSEKLDVEEAPITPTRVLKEQLKNEISKRTRDATCNNRTSPQLSNHYCITSVTIEGFRPPTILNFLKATCQNCAYRYELHATKKTEPRCPRCKKGQIKYSYDFDLDLKDDLGQTYEVHVGDDGARALLGSDFDPRLLSPEGNRLLRVKNKLAKIGIVEASEEAPGSTASLETKSSIWFDCCLRLSSTDLVVPKAEPVTKSQDKGYDDSQEDPFQPKSQPESQMVLLSELPPHSQTDVQSDSQLKLPRAGPPGTQHESPRGPHSEETSPQLFSQPSSPLQSSQPFSQPSSPVLSSQPLSQPDSPVLVMQPYSQEPGSQILNTQPLSQPGSPLQSLPLLEDMMRSQALETTLSKKRQPDRTLADMPKKPRLSLAFFEEEPQTQVHRSLVFTAIN
ncbi:hypothetical protein KVV02_007851 [Mortierella alpina]|uniref:Protection of telomeres protein 1 ssDNA-binding domain-containing protein n=1 Tax=Mortierella alpina TaxID=64518 RepID=A0A9P8CYW3_MORAP|nr:hypothetical protein KVV02_007851 [Mortierella alpina]